MTRREAELALVEVECPHCGGTIPAGQPAAKLLDPLPGETQPEYALRMRREWKRETRRPGRARARGGQSEEQIIEDTYAVLGVR